MIELRYERRLSHNGRTAMADILQFRTKDRHVESSTTTPAPLAWAKWKDVPIVEADGINAQHSMSVSNELFHAEHLAKRFHDKYEKLAPSFGYETRDSSAVDWCDVPINNKKLMIETCRQLIKEGIYS